MDAGTAADADREVAGSRGATGASGVCGSIRSVSRGATGCPGRADAGAPVGVPGVERAVSGGGTCPRRPVDADAAGRGAAGVGGPVGARTRMSSETPAKPTTSAAAPYIIIERVER